MAKKILADVNQISQISVSVYYTWTYYKAWSSIEEVPYCFGRSSIKFQGHTALKSVEFDPDWAFLDCNSSYNS